MRDLEALYVQMKAGRYSPVAGTLGGDLAREARGPATIRAFARDLLSARGWWAVAVLCASPDEVPAEDHHYLSCVWHDALDGRRPRD